MSADPFAPRVWRLAHGSDLKLGPKGQLMGILNVTPDSFSDGGRFDTVDAVVSTAKSMLDGGATILDLGAESTRPGAEPVDAQTEQARLLPALKAVAAAFPQALISADTYRADSAIKAIEAGAHIINDVWGLQREPEVASIVAEAGAGIVIMHTGRDRQTHSDPIEDQRAFLSKSLDIALAAGIAEDQIVLDPGFGFAKDPEMNIALMSRFEELHSLGHPILVGTSRKRFIGHFTKRDVGDRDVATAATTAILRSAGAAVLRVHDVVKNADALAIADAMIVANHSIKPTC